MDQVELSGLIGCWMVGRRGGISTAWRPALYSLGSRSPMIHQNTSSGLQQLEKGPVQASGTPLCRMSSPSQPFLLLSMGISPRGPSQSRGLLSNIGVQTVYVVGCLDCAKPSAWGEQEAPEGLGDKWKSRKILHVWVSLPGRRSQASGQGSVEMYLHVCASVWVAAGGVFWVCVRLCLCMCMCVGQELPGQSGDCAQACPAPRYPPAMTWLGLAP